MNAGLRATMPAHVNAFPHLCRFPVAFGRAERYEERTLPFIMRLSLALVSRELGANMMLITAVLWTLNVGFTLGAPSALGTGDAMAHWKAEIAAANEAWAGRRLAILKIDDAVYLKEGETAYLIFKDGSYRWSLTKPAGLRPQLRFANGKALLQMLGEEGDLDVLARPGGLFTLSDTADIKAQIAQIAPDQEGLRVMLYNQANPSPKEFKGVDYYPYDKAFAVTAKFEPAASIQGEDFQTSRGWWKRFYNMGTAVFALEGKEHRLPM
ncbi:MAG TPA: hypothetical protein DCL48_14705, partial [Alphaproteobacteria bacterium]|nr:hypothetical protein [Alphaproteobacteria bacterium]